MADHAGVNPSQEAAITDAVAAEATARQAADATKADKTTIATSVVQVKLDSKTTTATDTQVLGAAPFAGTITTIELIPNAAVTGDNTNTRTFTVTNNGQAGAGTTSVATLALTTGNDLVAFDAKAMTLSATPADLTVAAGDVLSCAQTVGASGLTHGGGVLRAVFTRS